MRSEVKPLGINTRDSDRVVKDGFLQESINLQWRDGSLMPFPERIVSDIYAAEYSNLIFHKVGDENQINVLGFTFDFESVFLAFDLAGGLTDNADERMLAWIGTIIDGVYTPLANRVLLGVHNTAGMSYTILNGVLYFMGDGSSAEEMYYIKLQFNEAKQVYEDTDMYEWKSLVPYYVTTTEFSAKTIIGGASLHSNVSSRVGFVLIRFAFVLKTGEIVLHSPIYVSILFGLTITDDDIKKDDAIAYIYSVINMEFDYDEDIFLRNVAAINIYAAIPYYKNVFGNDVDIPQTIGYRYTEEITDKELKGEIPANAEQPFYLIKTIEKSTLDRLILVSGEANFSIATGGGSGEDSTIDLQSIAAGELMPIDNFSYHYVYGKITSFNGRLMISKPVTVLSKGHIKSLSTIHPKPCDSGFEIVTEDGTISGIAQREEEYGLEIDPTIGILSKGLLSYPDARANMVGISKEKGNQLDPTEDGLESQIRKVQCKKNAYHNISCAFDFSKVEAVDAIIKADPGLPDTFIVTTVHDAPIRYGDAYEQTPINQPLVTARYSSVNRLQMSAAGEFSVFLAINSYRIGEGKIMGVGTNSVNPSNADIIAPLIIGTTDGVYTLNLDPTGQVLVSSITKTANMPYISEETIEIDGSLIFVSDKGLMAINNGDIVNLTEDFFPFNGSGNFPDNDTVFHNYNELTIDTLLGNSYIVKDIVGYMKGAIFAYDGSRGVLWCSNPAENFSLLFDTETKTWSMSTLVFYSKSEYYSLIDLTFGAIAQIDTVTISGTSGGAEIKIASQGSFEMIWGGSISATIDAFVTDHAADISQLGIALTSNAVDGKLIFTAKAKGFPFPSPVMTNTSGDLSGVTDNTQPNVPPTFTGEEVYTRYMVQASGEDNVVVLSGEDMTKEVNIHLLTRAIKLGSSEKFKLLDRMIARCVLIRDIAANDGYFSLGLWGKQDMNKYKVAIPIIAIKDSDDAVFTGGIRQDIPVNCRRGKYKSLAISLTGKVLPYSTIDGFDFESIIIEDSKLR